MTTTQTAKPQRLVHIFCEVGEHKYCSKGDRDQCKCACHYDTKILYGTGLGEFGFAIYELARSLEASFIDAEDRDDHYFRVIRAADGTVDFSGRTPEGMLAALRGTLERAAEGYWSMGKTLEDFGMNGRY